ncbi:phospholipid transport system transporter-binding protein [Luteibacter rhizovicinus]|uniref:Phospholipid transport system transporter-binding protein n=1 Tax=Luteibacter rhizovicinus TaxID=242606 RepID=A0A4R3YIU5_9GAMM|nr:STAS domain-containing protein [Luteibacter rhizovicinus]TCV92136.1 phospholipid transport system transporter-binding protein [Luteibacter rhizovicinus]
MSASAFSLETSAPDTLAVTGALSFTTAAAVLEATTAELTRGGQTTLDLAGVTHADSAGLACLLAVLASARSQGRTLTVSNVPAGLHALAQVSGVDQLV